MSTVLDKFGIYEHHYFFEIFLALLFVLGGVYFCSFPTLQSRMDLQIVL